jgi:hypothetical protein
MDDDPKPLPPPPTGPTRIHVEVTAPAPDRWVKDFADKLPPPAEVQPDEGLGVKLWHVILLLIGLPIVWLIFRGFHA